VSIPLIEHPESVVLVVMVGGELVCVAQTRPGAPGRTLELPSGKIEAGETPEQAARRELTEECGLAAGSLEPLGTFWVVPAYSTERTHVFHVTSFWRAPAALPPDEDEDIEVVRVPVSESRDRLSDAASLAALALWERRG
jgi:ADP-ribose pyrophosphatase